MSYPSKSEAYWLCITNDENWAVIKKKRIWGVPCNQNQSLAQVSKGDKLVFYIKPRRIGGIYEAAGDVFESEDRIFNSAGFEASEKFRMRIRLKPIVVLKNPITFVPLVKKMSFMHNKTYWGCYLFGKAMRRIDIEDFRTIEVALTQE